MNRDVTTCEVRGIRRFLRIRCTTASKLSLAEQTHVSRQITPGA